VHFNCAKRVFNSVGKREDMEKAQEVIKACQENLAGQNQHACNYFVRDVATELNNGNGLLNTTANIQISLLPQGPTWRNLGTGDAGATAALASADAGQLVIAGWENTKGHGHVAVVVKGLAVNGWPRGYWGQLGGQAGSNQGLRQSFGADKRAKTEFFAREF
jgi:hypothetical protein